MRTEGGRTTLTRRPPSGRSSSVMSPPCRRTTARTTVSPRPTPPVSRLREDSRRKKGAKTWLRIASGIPGPRSPTVISTALLNGLGIAAERSGSAIYSAAAGGFNFDVADPCSGIRSLLAMTALTAVYAYATQKTLLKKWILFLCSIPLAIIGNIARITTVALVAKAFGQKVATGLYHDYSGYIFFPVAIGLMVGVGSLLNLDFNRMWNQWKQDLLSPISPSSV